MADATELSHYTNYPMCGYCTNAWDIIFCRQMTLINCERWLSYCRWGGCDPDVWDYIDDRTGWPYGWKVDPASGMPRAFKDKKFKLPPPPPFDNRVFHMRANNDERAPWRKTSDRLRTAALARKTKIKNIDLKDVEWNDGQPEEDLDEDLNVMAGFPGHAPDDEIDLDDPDLWD